METIAEKTLEEINLQKARPTLADIAVKSGAENKKAVDAQAAKIVAAAQEAARATGRVLTAAEIYALGTPAVVAEGLYRTGRITFAAIEDLNDLGTEAVYANLAMTQWMAKTAVEAGQLTVKTSVEVGKKSAEATAMLTEWMILTAFEGAKLALETSIVVGNKAKATGIELGKKGAAQGLRPVSGLESAVKEAYKVQLLIIKWQTERNLSAATKAESKKADVHQKIDSKKAEIQAKADREKAKAEEQRARELAELEELRSKCVAKVGQYSTNADKKRAYAETHFKAAKEAIAKLQAK